MAKRRVFPSVRPVGSYPDPSYPTLTIHKENPGWLLYHAPPSWLRKDVAIGALATFSLSALSGGDHSQTTGQAGTGKVENTTTLLTNQPKMTESSQQSVSVAPVFVHGEGRGSSGCIAVAAPVFLSEDDAIEIILDELKSEGIDFDQRDYLVCGVPAPKTSVSPIGPEETVQEARESENFSPARRHVTADLFSKASNLGIFFVSTNDCVRLSDGMRSSLVVYDTLDLAQKMKEKLEAAREINAAVFYDPLLMHSWRPAPGHPHWYPNREEALKDSRELLKEQVRDFVTWMKKNMRQPAEGGVQR